MRLTSKIAIGALVAVAVAAASEPESTRVLENDLVTVTHHRYPAGATSAMHDHADRVNVFLTDLRVHVTTGEGEEFDAEREVGAAVWSEATSHALRAISGFEVVVVELRGTLGEPIPISPADATRVDERHHEIEFENDQVRIVRVKLPPGAGTPSHAHSLPAVTVLLGDAQIRVTGDDGQARVVDRHHGEVRWMDPVGRHTVENVGEADLLAIRVEIKQARRCVQTASLDVRYSGRRFRTGLKRRGIDSEEARFMIKKVAFIGHRVQDMARAKKFHGELLGVEVLMDVRDNKVCKMAIIKDSEGNGLMLHQIAPERAKS